MKSQLPSSQQFDNAEGSGGAADSNCPQHPNIEDTSSCLLEFKVDQGLELELELMLLELAAEDPDFEIPEGVWAY